MARVKSPNPSNPNKKSIRPAMTPEAREQQLISLAVDLVEQRLIDGTASAQETTHFLKLASVNARRKATLENEYLEKQNALIEAKTESIQSSKKQEELYKDAIEAMRRYSGHGDEYDY